MTRNILNYVIDALWAAVLVGLILTGLIVRYVLPPGSGGGRSLWSLGRHDWGDMHFWIAATAAALAVVHVALHWNWVCTMTRRVLGRSTAGAKHALARNISGAAIVAATAASLLLFVWIARSNVMPGPIDRAAAGGQRHGLTEAAAPEPLPARARGGQLIRGSMTLADTAAATGLSIDELKSRLSLPADVSSDARLGQLRQEYGLSMADVRDLVQ